MLLYFILGILFVEVATPVIESLVSLILTWIEVAEGKASLAITKLSADIQKIQKENALSDDTTVHRVIGFTLPDSAEDYEEEEEDEE